MTIKSKNIDRNLDARLKKMSWPHWDHLKEHVALLECKSPNELSLVDEKITTSHQFIDDHMKCPNDFVQLSVEWSDYAAASLDKALAKAWRTPRLQKSLTSLPPDLQSVPGLFVLGLGKLGGQDLNYSSDVDLVAFFDPDIVPIKPFEGKTDICNKVLKEMTQAIAGKTDDQRIWRVDWRLRPDPSVTGLSMATQAGLEFFAFKSAPWRRLAMMKARVVAGDHQTGQIFLDKLSSFVWRKTLDFRALDEIADMKERIKQEHPGLGASQPGETDLKNADGFHIKLGDGGIREIEFVVNALQLIWGGRLPEMRTTQTLQALEVCKQNEFISSDAAGKLRQAYIFLRRLENSVQMICDAQTHTIPDDTTERQLVANLMGCVEWQDVTNELANHRSVVSAQFRSSMTSNGTSTGTSNGSKKPRKHIKTIPPIDDEANAIFETWQAGFLDQGATPDQATSLAGLENSLLNAAKRQKDTSDALKQLNNFLKQLPKGGQYLRLLASNDKIAESIATGLLSSTPIANLLNQSPHVVDGLLETAGGFQITSDLPPSHPLSNPEKMDEETALETLRSWTNEQLFLTYMSVLHKSALPNDAAHNITQIAQTALNIALKLTCLSTGHESPPLAIASFGRLGMDNMHPHSDLDLLFLTHSENSHDLEEANRFSLRLRNVLGTKMKAGRVWEIDMRLRPSGRAGPPTLRPSSFKSHQLERAKTWEHIALIAGRFICGNQIARTVFNETRQKVLTTPRDQSQLIKDCASMLMLLRQERIKAKPEFPFEVKLIHGGLMEAEFLLHMLVLKWGAKHPDLAKMAYSKLAQALGEIDAQLKPLSQAIGLLQQLQFISRLHGDTHTEVLGPLKNWKMQRETATKQIQNLLQTIIFGPAKEMNLNLKTYQEETVRFNVK